MSGQGCPICKESKIEREIRNFLNNNNINFEAQKKFKWLGRQSLDFYLSDYQIAIECQGIQHFVDDAWSHKNTLKNIMSMDEKKRIKCVENNVKLLYFSNLGIDYPYEVIEDKNELLTKINQK